MIALDASVLVAHFNPRDGHHDAARRLLADASAETLIVHPLTMAEVLVGGVRVGRGDEMLSDLRAIGVHLAPHDEEQPTRLAQLRASTGLKLPGCCVIDTARTNGAVVATFDDPLARRAHELGLDVNPAPTR